MMLIATAAFGLVGFVRTTHSPFTIRSSHVRHHYFRLHSRNSEINNTASDEQEEYVQSTSNAETKLLMLAQSHFVAQALLAFVRLGLPDIMSVSHAMTVDEIVSHSEPSPIRRDVLYRCLRLLCTAGIITETIERVHSTSQSAFALSDVGALLRTSNPQSMAPFIQHWMEEPLWNAWSRLPDYLAGGGDDRNPFDAANEISASEYYTKSKESQKHRNAVARYASSTEIASILDLIQSNASHLLNEMSLSSKTIVDIGGGYGDLLIELKRRLPTVGKCHCLDLPDVIEDAKSTSNDRESIVALVAGDMFDHKTIPECNVILTKHVLCDFSDDDVVLAMKSFHKALSSSGKLVIMDAVLPNEDALNGKWNPAVSFDVLLMLSGRRGERSRLEWSNLALEAGFVLDEVVPTASVTVDLAIFTKKESTDGNDI
jgi:ubiquinone/menaquinone biosynthesis C-methylase UbiE